jgi:hypothetical protein
MNERPPANEGIIIGGSAQVHDSALAAGYRARAHLDRPVDTSGEDVRDVLEAILGQLDDLHRLITQHEPAVSQAEQAARDIDDVRGEIIRARNGGVADGDRVRHALERLSGRIGALGALAGALDTLKEAILRVTH